MTTTKTSPQNAESYIRQAVTTWAQAGFAKDLDTVMALYAQDVRAFDVPTPLQFKGKAVYKKHWQKCMEMCAGGETAELLDLEVHVHGDIAWSAGIVSFASRDEDGQEQDTCFIRLTQVWQREGDTWLIRHEHCSAPIDMETQKAVFDVRP